MSVGVVYAMLKPSILEVEGFQKKADSAVWGAQELSLVNGLYRLYLENGLDLPLPEELQPHVVLITTTATATFKAMKDRLFGEYEHKTAKATLDAISSNYVIKLTGTKPEDMNELYRLIRAGAIAPVRSWTEPQVKRVKLAVGQIAVVEVIKAFIKAKFPDHEIVDVEVGDSHEEEGYFPTVTICPADDYWDKTKHFQVYLNVWVGGYQYVKWQNEEGEEEMIDLRRTAESVYELLPARETKPA